MKSLLRLKPYLWKHRKMLLFGVAAIVANNLLTVVQPQLVGWAIDALRTGLRGGQGGSDPVITYALLVVGLTLAAGIFSFLTRQTIIVMSRHIEFDLRNDFLAHLQKLSLSFFLIKPTGDLMAHATNDISSVRNIVGPCIMYPLDTVLTFVLTVTLMFINDWQLTLLALIPLPLVSWLVFHLGKKLHRYFDERQAQFSLLTSHAQENFSGIRILQAYNRQADQSARFHSLSQVYLKKNMAVARIQSLMWPLMFVLIGCSIIITLLAGGLKVIGGKMTIGTLTAFFGYLVMLIWPMIAFGWVANMVQQGAASMERLNRIFDTQPEVASPDPIRSTLPQTASGTIEFQGVSFCYPGSTVPALRLIDLTILSGQTVAIVGYTGSGKSTLVNLIPRLADPTTGRVLIDGVDVRDLPLQALRSCIGYVRQEAFLFSDTVAGNISYGATNPTDEQIRRAAGVAQLDGDITSFPNGYQTVIGERGITLSGGQKQRLSIARSLIRDPRILILDDALSAVDTITEERILQGLKPEMRRRTCLVISHRISTVKDADMIVVLNAGEIAERGTHEQLLAKGGIYAELYAKQILEDELELL